MEPKHRQSIDTHCALIVRQIDIKALWPYLFINGIYNYDNFNVSKWTKDLTNLKTIKEIILCASGADTRFSVTAENNGMLCIPLQRNIM